MIFGDLFDLGGGVDLFDLGGGVNLFGGVDGLVSTRLIETALNSTKLIPTSLFGTGT